MEAGWLAEWLSTYDGGSQVRVKVRLPDIEWEVDDWFPEVVAAPDSPEIVAEVRGFDLDYPDVARRLKDAADRLAYYNFV